MSTVSREVVDAYRAAIYEVDGPTGSMRLRIDELNAAADRLLAHAGVSTAAFITAYNPASVALCEAENRAAHENLQGALERRSFPHVAARGLDPAKQWPAEPGFLVLGLAREDAVALGRQFDQNGIVWLVAGRAPELVLLR